MTHGYPNLTAVRLEGGGSSIANLTASVNCQLVIDIQVAVR